MIEMLAGLSAFLAALLIIAIVFAVTYRQERDLARAELETAFNAQEILENRVTVLKMDRDERDQTISELRRVNTDLHRENGRLKAEAVANKPKRGPGGKFVAKPKAEKKPKPVACG